MSSSGSCDQGTRYSRSHDSLGQRPKGKGREQRRKAKVEGASLALDTPRSGPDVCGLLRFPVARGVGDRYTASSLKHVATKRSSYHPGAKLLFGAYLYCRGKTLSNDDSSAMYKINGVRNSGAYIDVELHPSERHLRL